MTKIIERHSTHPDHPDNFLREAGIGGISFAEVENMTIVASQSIQEGACYSDPQGRTAVVRGFPTDHPSEQKKVLYENDRGELHTCSLAYFSTRYKLEAATQG